MKLFDLNMTFLQAKLPSLFQALTVKKLLANEVKHIQEEDNFLLSGSNFRVFMHSKYNQERERHILLDKIKGSTDTIILFGFGNGKTIEEIGKKFPVLKQLIIVDPNPEPMLSFLQRRDINDILPYFHHISFIVNKTVKETENLLGQMIQGHNRPTVLSHLTYQTIYPDYYRSLWQIVYNIIRFKAVNTITAEAHREKWVVNVWRNLKYDAADIGTFSEVCKGVPAILIAAGPSLSKNIHLLNQVKPRALLVAVGSAMTVLSSHGIVPHFRVAIDGNEANQDLFAKVDTTECPLIYSNRLFYGILPQYKASKIHMAFGNDDVLEDYILDKAEVARMPVRSGFSVANSAMDMLIKLGCSKIILVGQDLCYTGNRLHANGAWDESAEVLRETDKASDIFGNQVYTNKPYLGMKDLFQFLIASAKNTQFINATEGGLAINGAPNKTLAEVIEQDLTVDYNFTAAIEQLLGTQKEATRERKLKIDTAVDNIQAVVYDLLERNKRILSKLAKVEQKVNCGVSKQKVLTELHMINALAKKQMQIDFFREVVYPTFSGKFIIRGNKLLTKKEDPQQLCVEELNFLRMNMMELREYLTLTAKLIVEYKDAY